MAAQFSAPTGQAVAPASGLLIHQPREPRSTTSNSVVHVLGRTAAGAQVRVAGEPVAVQRTGVFARDGIPLQAGSNSVLIEARMPDGMTVHSQVLEIERVAAPPDAPATAPAAVEPMAPALYVAGPAGAALTHGVHEVRLGGPVLAGLPARTLLMVNGRSARHYRVALATSQYYDLLVDEVNLVPPQPGELAFAELMRRPTAALDAKGEYVEVMNVAARPLSLRGVRLSSNTGAATLAPNYRLLPGERTLFVRHGNPLDNGGIRGGHVLPNGRSEEHTSELQSRS